MNKKFVYAFSEGNAKMRELLGGKGANLAEMTVLGMPVPQGFTVTTEACTQYYEDGKQISPEIEAEILNTLENSKSLPAKNSATSTIRCWFPSAPVQELPCRA